MLVEVDAEIADLDRGLTARQGPAKGGAQPCKELVDAERLGDVVVGARVERSDLLALLADGRENEDRRLEPAAQLAADVHSALVGEDEVEDDRVRWMRGRPRERVLARGRRLDVVAGTAQGGLERAQDLGLVVDDEDPRRVRHASAPTGTSTSGSASTRDAPCPRCDSAQTRPPLPSAKPLAIASPSPLPPRSSVVATRANGSKMRSSSDRGIPGPRSTILTITSLRVVVTRTWTASPGGENLSAFSRRLTSTRSTWMASTWTMASCGRQRERDAVSSRELLERLSEKLLDGPELPVRLGRAGLEPRDVEQVADHPLQPVDLEPHRLEESRSVGLVERETRAAQALGRDFDRGQRRAQVVAHGLQNGGLDRVAPPERLGLDRFAREALAIESRPQRATPAQAGIVA